jgi:hypothetical protein
MRKECITGSIEGLFVTERTPNYYYYYLAPAGIFEKSIETIPGLLQSIKYIGSVLIHTGGGGSGGGG